MVAVKFWQLCIKLLQTSVWRFCLDVSFQLLWVYMIIGLYSKSIFHFLINHQTIFESGCTILHSYHICMRLPVALQPHLRNMWCCQCYGIWPSSQVCIGEGDGTPLQCSCLENPRDGGAWWAAVHGVAQSRTRLKWLSSSIGVYWFLCQFLMVIQFLTAVLPCTFYTLIPCWLLTLLVPSTNRVTLFRVFW